MSVDQVVVFVHGLAEVPEVWNAQIDALPDGFSALPIDVFGAGRGTNFSLGAAAAHIRDEIDKLGVATVHLCGLSLGAMVALRFAIDSPDRVRSLLLAAGQVRPPRVLMGVQRTFMTLLPAKWYARSGVEKAQMLAVLAALKGTDFSGELQTVTAPTLVLCGSKDRPSIPGSRALAAGISNAELLILPGAGHQSHLYSPAGFSGALAGLLRRAA